MLKADKLETKLKEAKLEVARTTKEAINSKGKHS